MAENEAVLLEDRDWRRRNSMWMLPALVLRGLHLGVVSLRRGQGQATLVGRRCHFYGLAFVLYFLLSPPAPEAESIRRIITSDWLAEHHRDSLLLGGLDRGRRSRLDHQPRVACLPGIASGPDSNLRVPTDFDDHAGDARAPWRSFVSQALTLQREIVTTVADTAPGPMQDRLQAVADSVDTGLTECWQVAQGGRRLTKALARIDTAAIAQQLSRFSSVRRTRPSPRPRNHFRPNSTRDAHRGRGLFHLQRGLVLLNARLGEVAARVIELSARPHALNDAAEVDSVVESVVNELVAIRQALTEMDQHPPSG